MAEKPQFGPATPASTPAESAAQKHTDATGERKFRIPPDFHDVTAERFSKTAARLCRHRSAIGCAEV